MTRGKSHFVEGRRIEPNAFSSEADNE
jgi:hypothetical protein